MTTGKNRLLSDPLIPNAPHGVRLDLAAISAANDAEAMLAKIISEETEKRRESERGKHGKVQQGLLGTTVDYVDTQRWDEYLQDIEVLAACAERAGVARTSVLDFAIEKCFPSNWSALFWMHAWYLQVYRNAEADKTETSKELEILYSKKQTESARQRARQMAEAKHDKPGGSREKRAAIRAAWASGKYASRDVCAEQECAALNMSISTARKALRNTPDPV